jgi:hypothetical protein
VQQIKDLLHRDGGSNGSEVDAGHGLSWDSAFVDGEQRGENRGSEKRNPYSVEQWRLVDRRSVVGVPTFPARPLMLG